MRQEIIADEEAEEDEVIDEAFEIELERQLQVFEL